MLWAKKKEVKEEAKRLFQYWDGSETRSCDPFFTWRKYEHHEGIDHDSLELVDKNIEPFTTDFVSALCDVFNVSRYDEATETGLTELEIMDLVNQLSQWFEDLKKNGDGSLILSEHTDSPPSISPEPQIEATN